MIPLCVIAAETDAILGYLQKNPQYRLGCNCDFLKVASHSFCRDIDWHLVSSRLIVNNLRLGCRLRGREHTVNVSFSYTATHLPYGVQKSSYRQKPRPLRCVLRDDGTEGAKVTVIGIENHLRLLKLMNCIMDSTDINSPSFVNFEFSKPPKI